MCCVGLVCAKKQIKKDLKRETKYMMNQRYQIAKTRHAELNTPRVDKSDGDDNFTDVFAVENGPRGSMMESAVMAPPNAL